MLEKLSVPARHPQSVALHLNSDLSSLTVTDLQMGTGDSGLCGCWRTLAKLSSDDFMRAMSLTIMNFEADRNTIQYVLDLLNEILVIHI